MPKLDSYLGKGAGQSPLPTFGMWYHSNSTLTIYDSHYRPISDLGMSAVGGEFYASLSAMYTVSAPSTNAFSNNGVMFTGANSFYGNGYFNSGLGVGGFPYNPNISLGYNSVINPVYNLSQVKRFAAPVIDYAGYNPNWCFYLLDTSLGTMGLQARSPLTSTTWTLYASPTSLSGTSNNYGQACYNVKNNKLVIVRSNTSQELEIHEWVNPNVKIDHTKNNLTTFLSGAFSGVNGATYTKRPVFTWAVGDNTTLESRYCHRVLVLDNGDVAIVKSSTNQNNAQGLYYGVYSQGSFTSIDSLTNVNLKYGVDQNSAYSPSVDFTWDNKWAIVYSHTYYYGSGMFAFIINLEHPSSTLPLYYKIDFNNTSWGVQVSPIKESSFYFSYAGQNREVDCAGLKLYGKNQNGATVPPNSSLSLVSHNSLPYNVTTTKALVRLNQWVDPAVRKYK